MREGSEWRPLSPERERNDKMNEQHVGGVEIVTGSVDLAVILRLFSFVCFLLLRGYDYYPFLSSYSLLRRVRLILYASLPLCPFPSPPHQSLPLPSLLHPLRISTSLSLASQAHIPAC